jgi:hypothetical protein
MTGRDMQRIFAAITESRIRTRFQQRARGRDVSAAYGRNERTRRAPFAAQLRDAVERFDPRAETVIVCDHALRGGEFERAILGEPFRRFAQMLDGRTCRKFGQGDPFLRCARCPRRARKGRTNRRAFTPAGSALSADGRPPDRPCPRVLFGMTNGLAMASRGGRRSSLGEYRSRR